MGIKPVFNPLTGQFDMVLTGKVDFDSVTFNNDYVPTGTEPIGTTYWDSTNRTISTILTNGVTGQHFKELFIDAQNDTAGTITNGSPVAYAGSIGNSGNFRIKLAQASASEPAYMNIGIVTHDISNVAPNNIGKITIVGKVRGIQTDGANYGEVWADGDIVYISGSTAGWLTKNPPNAPIPAIPIALVISAHATNGTLEVRPTFPQKMSELSDFNGTTPVDGSMIYWNDTNKYWDAVTTVLYDWSNDRFLAPKAYIGDIAGGDYSEIEADGTMVAHGDATTFEDLQFPVSSGKVPAANFPSWETFTTNTNQYAFSVNDFIQLACNEPFHSWREGTACTIHVHFAIKTAQNTGADRFVKFQFTVAYADFNSVWAEYSPLTAEATIPTGSVALQSFWVSSATTILSGVHINSQVLPAIKRITATGGTEYADDVYITQVGVHLEQDMTGSRTVSSK